MNCGNASSASRHGAELLIASLILPALFGACSGTSGGSDAGVTSNAVIKNENNYTTTSKLTIPHVQTASGADLTVCWTTLATDLLGHAVNPAVDIDGVTFLQIINHTEDQIATEFAAGAFKTTSVKKYMDYRVDHTVTPASTCATLSTFKFGGVALAPDSDYITATDKKYMLLFAKGNTPGSGSKTMVFLDPVASSTNTTVNAPEGGTILQFAADLTTPPAVSIPVAGPWVVDWSQLTKDGAGGEVVFQKIDSLLLGHYEGLVADLQASCLDYDRIAGSTLYQVPIVGGATNVDLATTKTAAGVAFTGFSPLSGVWAVGLLCSTCQVPAPVAISILNPS